jgi:hypothetical protein
VSWFRRTLGLDGFDLVVHLGVTAMFMAFVAMSNGPEELFPVLAGGSLLVLAVRRRIALKAGPATGRDRRITPCASPSWSSGWRAGSGPCRGGGAGRTPRFNERLLVQGSRNPGGSKGRNEPEIGVGHG